MLKHKKRIQHRFVETIPTTLQQGVLYVSLNHNMVSHLCACGCGQRIDTPLARDEWQLIYNGEGVSLYPSIGNWDLSCRSHYFINNSMVAPVPKRKKRFWLF